MADRLKIYACSGIGDQAQEQQTFDYWLDNNSNVLRQTQAVNTLLAKIDSNYTELQYVSVTNERALQLLNEIDLYSICLYYAELYSGDEMSLKKAGKVIGSLCISGVFDFASLNNAERDAHLNELYAITETAIGQEEKYNGDKAFNKWWDDTVVKRDKYFMTDSQYNTFVSMFSQAMEKSGIGAIDPSWQNDQNISKYLNEAGNYFLYTFFTESQLAKLPRVFTDKAIGQMKVYNYCSAYFVGVYGSEEDMKRVIRTQITKKFGATPEKVCKKIAQGGKVSGVGLDPISWAEIISLVGLLVTFLVSVIKAICDYCYKENLRKYQMLDDSIKDDCMSEEDYDDVDMTDKKDLTEYIPYIAAGLGLLILLKK